MKIFLLAPDKGSGKAFNKAIKKEGIGTKLKFYKIPPRVLNNKLNDSKNVTKSFENSLLDAKKTGLQITIACNTLQFWLKKVDKKILKGLKVFTTFEACEFNFKKLKEKPLWLGTTPTSKIVKTFPTFIKIGEAKLQNSVQELIWRIKMINGDDISGAPLVVKKDKTDKRIQNNKINKLKNEILNGLQNLKIKNVILGCTELPIVFNKLKEKDINFFDPAVVLSKYIKSQFLLQKKARKL